MPADIRRLLKKFLPHLIEARENDRNEAETSQRIVTMFREIFGYDDLKEISKEKFIKGKYVDLAIKIDGRIKFLVEVKDANTKLRDHHIDQATHYAADGNIPFVVLTNGLNWYLYHLTFGKGIEAVRVFALDLTGPDFDKAAELLSLLHRRSVKKGKLKDYAEKQNTLTPEAIGKALFHERVLRVLRRELRRKSKILVEEEEIAESLYGMFSPITAGRIGPLKIGKKTKGSKKGPPPLAHQATEVKKAPAEFPVKPD